MSNIINIKERANKLYWENSSTPIVCGNTNYVIQFDFDTDWQNVTNKQATFEILDKKIFIDFTGNTLNMPAMPNAYYCMLSLTCTPGDNQIYSTPAVMLYLQQNELGIEVQTMDPFVGYYSSLLNSIKKVEDGDIICKQSTFATTAESATSATNATNALNATNATYAENAGSAATATNANHATTADSATSATNATYAESAGSATSASLAATATNADHATTADSATSATNATYATTSHTSETQVSLTGNENIGGEKNFTTGIKKLGNTIPNTKEIANTNLLLNAGFKINQRELSSYSGANTYSVDRWKLVSSSATAEKINNSWVFSLENINTAESNIIISQVIENYNELAGQPVTASIKYSNLTEDVTGTTTLAIYDGVSTAQVVLTNENYASVTLDVSANATTLAVQIMTTSDGLDCSITPVWCKLEVGNLATMYEPRQTSEDLWLCQRYFQRVILEGQTGNYYTAYLIQPLLVLPNSLRTTPTITTITFPIVYGNGTKYNTVSWTFKKLVNNLLSLHLKTGNNSTSLQFTAYDFYCLRNGEITLDAEIY